MSIFARSPYIVEISETGQEGSKVQLFIWNGTGSAPANPQYTLDKLIPASNNVKTYYNISPYIREYITWNTRQTPYNTFSASQTTQEEKVSDITSEAPIATEAVEAAKSEPVALTATQPVAYTKPRSPINSKATYLEHSIRAALGSDESRQFVAFADNTTDNAGFIPTPQSTTLINGVSNADRGFIDALSKETLPASGMTFELPRINTAPTVALTAEEGTPSETDQATAFISVDVKKFAGQQTISLELIDRSSPLFFYGSSKFIFTFCYVNVFTFSVKIT